MRLVDLVITLGILAFPMGQATHPVGLQPGSPWPKLQGDAANDGNGPGGGSNGSIRWQTPISVANGSTPTIAANGTIYAASSGTLVAISPVDGSKEWSFPTGCQPGIQSSPAIGTDGTIYVTGSGAPLLLAMNPNGQEKWQFSGLADGGVYQPTGAPTIGQDGTIYFPAEEFVAGSGAGLNQNYLFALNPDGSVKWEFGTGPANIIGSSPAIGTDGTPYFGSSNQSSSTVSGNFYAVDPTTGSLKWSFTTTGQIVASPAVGPDGSIYAGEQGGTKNLYRITPDGTPNIVFTGTGSIVSTPAVASDSSLYFPESDGSYYALNVDGTVRWSFPPGSCTAEATVIGSDGTIYFGTRDGHVISAFQQGTTIWSYPSSAAVSSSLAIGEDGTLYYGGTDGMLNALGTEIDTVPTVGLSLAPATIVGGKTSMATVTIQSQAPKGGALVHIQSSDPSVSVPPFTEVASGDTQTSFFVGSTASSNGLQATITAASGGTSASATLAVLGATLANISIAPASLVAPAGATGTVTLSAPAPTGGVTVQLSSSSRSIGIPSMLTVPAAMSSATFSITTSPVTATTVCTVTAAQGPVTASASVTIVPPTPTSLAVSPASVLGGSTAIGTVTLNGVAGQSGQPVSLSSSNSSASVPSGIAVPPGKSTVNFTISTLAVSFPSTATITAAVGSASATAQLTVNPVGVASLKMNPAGVTGGSNVTGTLTTSSPAPTSGLTISLSSSEPSVAKAPAMVSVPKGKTSATFVVETMKVSTQQAVTFQVSLNGTSQTALLTINPPALTQLSLNPTSALGGKTATGTVTLQTTAPAGGVVIELSSSNPAVAAVPTSVTIGSGKKSATFKVTTFGVSEKTALTIAAILGPTSKTATLTVTPATLVSLSLSPSKVKGGSPSTGTVTISGPAPAGGLTVRLSSNKSVATVPQMVTVPAGQTKAAFAVSTSKVTAQTSATLSAALATTVKSASLTLTK